MKRFFNTTTKIMIWFVILNAEVQLYLCFFLAYLGKNDVLEILGKAIVAEIIGPLIALIVKTVIENIFEKNNIFPARKQNEEFPCHRQEDLPTIWKLSVFQRAFLIPGGGTYVKSN